MSDRADVTIIVNMDRRCCIKRLDPLALRKQADDGTVQGRKWQDRAMGASQYLPCVDACIGQGSQVAPVARRAALQCKSFHREPSAPLPDSLPRVRHAWSLALHSTPQARPDDGSLVQGYRSGGAPPAAAVGHPRPASHEHTQVSG